MNNIEENNKILYFSQDITELVIVVGNHKFRIYENLIKHFVDGTRLVEKVDIDKETFYEFANYVVAITNGWNDFSTIVISPESKWSVVIKTNNNGTKRYAGIDYCPNNWNEFCNTFDNFFVNKSVDINNTSSIYGKKSSYESIISLEYNKNGITTNLVNEITKFTIMIIEDFEQDRFWSDSARCFLGLLILSNLNNAKEINVKKLLYQIADINSVKSIIINNIDELKKYPQLQIFINNAKIIESDKTLKSILELIEDGLIKYHAKYGQEEFEEEDIITQKDRVIIIPKNISEISQETLANMYFYKMNEQEKEKLKLLNIDENKYERVIEFIKYINGIGYIVVDYIRAMINNNGVRMEKDIYKLEVEPELDLNKAKKKINKFLKECYSEE